MRNFVWLCDWIALCSCCLPSTSVGSYGQFSYSGTCSDPYYNTGSKKEYCEQQPTEFPHGTYQTSIDHVGQEVLVFSCDVGYVLLGSHVLTCQCGLWSHVFPKCAARDCLAHLQSGHKNSGIYGIVSDRHQVPVVFVYCDMTSDGGGWTVIQRRVDGTVNFYRDWSAYNIGFGDPGENFWIGLEMLYHLTGPNSEMVINMESELEGQALSAHYESFRVGERDENYRLLVSRFSGTARDSLGASHYQAFSSPDMDNDENEQKCSVTHQGSWWYRNCTESNLNGRYGHETEQGIFWKHDGAALFLSFVEMKVRRKMKN